MGAASSANVARIAQMLVKVKGSELMSWAKLSEAPLFTTFWVKGFTKFYGRTFDLVLVNCVEREGAVLYEAVLYGETSATTCTAVGYETQTHKTFATADSLITELCRIEAVARSLS